jgi:beta-phosphoglucomutase-like phosphatase (HAD superfamily)
MRVTLGATGLLARFQNRIFSSSDVSRGKPFPDLYPHAAKAMGVSPERCAVVEDTVVGVTAGVAARMAVFGFARDGHSSPVDLERAGATVFSDMLSLPRLVQDLSSDAGATQQGVEPPRSRSNFMRVPVRGAQRRIVSQRESVPG